MISAVPWSRPRRRGLVLTFLGVLAAALVVPLQEAQAVPLSLVVTETGDGSDAAVGDGVCDAVSGGCTLRAAIQEANANPGQDTVSFPPLSVFHTGERISLTASGPAEDAAWVGDLDITDSLTINGNGARRTIVDGAGLTSADRVFDVDPAGTGASVELRDLTIRGGAGGDGAGVRVRGALVLQRSVVENNATGGRGGGVLVDAPTATTVLDDVVVRANRAQEGAGVANRGTLEVHASSVEGNVASGGTAGVSNTGVARIFRTTVSGNRTTGSGPGFFAGGVMTSGAATLENVTISGNTGDPGGLLNGGPTRLVNVTVADNTGGIFNHAAAGGTLRAVNTIVAESPFFPGVNCYGPIISQGHNLEDSASCGFTTTSDLQHTPPALERLAFSVGRTRTHALPPTTPAVDAGDPASCPAVDQRGVPRPQGSGCDIGAHETQVGGFLVNSPVDDVDVAPGDGVCQTAVPTQCTLRAAVIETNALAGPDLIRFRTGARIPLTLTGTGEDLSRTGDLDVTDDLTILGNGSTATVITTVGTRLHDRLLHVLSTSRPGVAVQVRGVSIDGGNPSSGDGGNVLVGDLTEPAPPRLVMDDVRVRRGTLGALSHGGGIATEGDLDLTGSAVLGNRASSGGGVSASFAADLTVVGSAIKDNTATDSGGGIFLGVDATGRLTRTDVSGNSAAVDGGGVWNVAALHAAGTTMTGNQAARWGGGLFNQVDASAVLATSTLNGNVAIVGGGAYNAGRLSVTASTVNDNDAQFYGGGGINNGLGTTQVENSTISGNQGTLGGGGIRNTTNGTVTLASSTVADNTANSGAGIMNSSGSVSVLSSILANPGDNCQGPVTSRGHNLETGSTCAFGAGDLSSTVPRLGPLSANGGVTMTHALLSGSPARDFGAGGPDCPATDQRGVPRPQGSGCDSGAYEAM